MYIPNYIPFKKSKIPIGVLQHCVGAQHRLEASINNKLQLPSKNQKFQSEIGGKFRRMLFKIVNPSDCEEQLLQTTLAIFRPRRIHWFLSWG